MKTPKLSVIEKIGFGGGDAAVNVVWSSLALIITFFYTDVFRLNPAHIAMLGLIPRLVDAFADVGMGMFTDSHTTRWGRYRPYLLAPRTKTIALVYCTPPKTPICLTRATGASHLFRYSKPATKAGSMAPAITASRYLRTGRKICWSITPALIPTLRVTRCEIPIGIHTSSH